MYIALSIQCLCELTEDFQEKHTSAELLLEDGNDDTDDDDHDEDDDDVVDASDTTAISSLSLSCSRSLSDNRLSDTIASLKVFWSI